MIDTSTGRRWEFSALGNSFYINAKHMPGMQFRFQQNGDLTMQGSLYANGGTHVFPDYVFEDNYRLMALDDLKRYVAENKRLPNVPSQDEVKETGINMTALQLRLLEKIEELTLYTLQQEQIIQRQDRAISEMNGRLDALEKKQTN